MVAAMWARLLTAALGVWLMAAPDVLGYGGRARTGDHIVGPLIVATGIIAIWEVVRPVRWVGLALGVWLVLAPWLLGGRGEALVNSTLVGLLVVALSLVGGRVRQRFGGGWTSLWRGEARRQPEASDAGTAL